MYKTSKAARELKSMMTKKGITQIALADMLGLKNPDIHGRQIVWRWLKGMNRPAQATRNYIAVLTDNKIKADDWER